MNANCTICKNHATEKCYGNTPETLSGIWNEHKETIFLDQLNQLEDIPNMKEYVMIPLELEELPNFDHFKRIASKRLGCPENQIDFDEESRKLTFRPPFSGDTK